MLSIFIDLRSEVCHNFWTSCGNSGYSELMKRNETTTSEVDQVPTRPQLSFTTQRDHSSWSAYKFGVFCCSIDFPISLQTQLYTP